MEDLIINAQLPSSIDVVTKLQESISSGIASASDFAKQMESDAGLSARILKLANSAFYGRGSIDSVEQAIVLIGENDIISLVLSTEVIDALSIENVSFDLKEYWRENIYSAICAKIIARSLNIPKSPIFTATLLRRVGWLVLWRAKPQLAAELTEQLMLRQQAASVLEVEYMEATHGQLGADLLTHWKLPDTVTEPIRYYQTPQSAPADHQKAAAILYLADSQMQAEFVTQYNTSSEDSDPEWLDALLTVPAETLKAEAAEEVRAHFEHMQRMLLG